MTSGDLFVAAFVAFATAGMTALFWRQMSGLRDEMRQGFRELREEMRSGDAKLRTEMQSGHASIRSELAELGRELRAEMQSGDASIRSELAELRAEIATMRSDLTHVALAVGARARPSEA